jgi:hypothetical protein
LVEPSEGVGSRGVDCGRALGVLVGRRAGANGQRCRDQTDAEARRENGAMNAHAASGRHRAYQGVATESMSRAKAASLSQVVLSGSTLGRAAAST